MSWIKNPWIVNPEGESLQTHEFPRWIPATIGLLGVVTEHSTPGIFQGHFPQGRWRRKAWSKKVALE